MLIFDSTSIDEVRGRTLPGDGATPLPARSADDRGHGVACGQPRVQLPHFADLTKERSGALPAHSAGRPASTGKFCKPLGPVSAGQDFGEVLHSLHRPTSNARF